MGRSDDIRISRTVGPEEASPATDASAFAATLERIRVCLHGWLDRIEGRLEAAAPTPAAGPDPAPAARALEEQRDALRKEAERRDREWTERLEALENDRRLLADAWERLELAQSSAPAIRPMAAAPSSVPSAAMSSAPPPRSDPENPIDRAILRQFEILRRDVRRTAKAQKFG
jgi:hypothetical protein